MFHVSSDIVRPRVRPVGSVATDVVDFDQLCSPGKYVAAVYDELRYVDNNIADKDDDKQGVLVNFMRPLGFFWTISVAKREGRITYFAFSMRNTENCFKTSHSLILMLMFVCD